ncbi:hypothetical protein D9M72_520070 [compost metagenome]
MIIRVVFQWFGDEADPLVGHAIARGGVEVNAQYAGRFDVPTGFLEGFAHGGFGQGFVRVQMAGGLIEHHASVLEFLDHQEAAVVFDDGGDGDVGFPVHEFSSNSKAETHSNIGVSLLAMTVGQSPQVLNGIPQSRAGSFLQWNGVDSENTNPGTGPGFVMFPYNLKPAQRQPR